MLDLDHPMSKHIFHAARLMDRAMQLGQKMSVSPSTDRKTSLADSTLIVDEMRALAHDHLGNQAETITDAVNEYEYALRELAALGNSQITDDRRDGHGSCPVCGTKITHMPKYGIALCGQCAERFMVANKPVRRWTWLLGYGTLMIVACFPAFVIAQQYMLVPSVD